MKILQINTNRSRASLDMALHIGKNIKASLILVSEPNRLTIRDRKDWIFDKEIDTAIKILDKDAVIIDQGHGPGFTYVKMTKFTIYSCYSSPNKDPAELEYTLYKISQLIRRNKESAIVTGDFNAKSPQWGMTYTDHRGQIMTEWIAENNLIVANKGDRPTFQRLNCSSILDLTIVTEDVNRNIRHWEVSEAESLSDHNFIIFEVTDTKQFPQILSRSRLGWQLRKLDKQKFEQEVMTIKENERLTSAEGFSQELCRISNKTMPKKRNQTRRKPVYWWNDDIAKLQKECMKSRRAYTRHAKKSQAEDRQEKWEEYMTKKKKLRDSIKKAKKSSWKQLCDEVDKDIWGNGYKIVTRAMLGFPPRIKQSMAFTGEVAGHLFPVHDPVTFKRYKDAKFEPFTHEELKKACDKLRSKKAPGPGKILPEILQGVAAYRPKIVLDVYNKLAAEGQFPEEWKRAVLVLLKKGDKPINSPGSYRPICLLDVEGKLYEQLIVARLKKELAKTGDLSDRQFGFRRGRQTVDAIRKVLKIADEAEAFSSRNRRLCAVITLDVRNAFNSASWQMILEELVKRQVDKSLINIISSYLSERSILIEAEGQRVKKNISSGVPQGSVLGPTLWNILYDGVLEIDQPEGVTLIGFADDIVMVVTAIDESTLMSRANTALQRVDNWMETKNLHLAPEKTEAALLTKKRKIEPIHFMIHDTVVNLSNQVRYLGVWLDTKLTFSKHIEKALQKAEKTVTALSRLMPNIGGPRASKRKTMSSVIHSQILYAAPAWHSAIKKKGIRTQLNRTQRGMLIRVVSSYRTISAAAAGIIAGIPPLDLLVQERLERYEGASSKDAKTEVIERWQERWRNSKDGRWTYRLIPEIKTWIERPFGEVDYFLTQALSGHGCFMDYLHGKKRSETDKCRYCKQTKDDVEHTLYSCPRWEGIRQIYKNDTGNDFNRETMMRSLTTSRKGWEQAYRIIRHIIEHKEIEHRETA